MSILVVSFLVLFVPVGAFVFMLVDGNCEKGWVTKIAITLLITVLFVGAFGGSIMLDNNMDNTEWNDGKCECGGTYKFANGSTYRLETIYFYSCDTCDHVIELSNPRN